MEENKKDVKIGDEISYTGRVLAIGSEGNVAIQLPLTSRKVEYFIANLSDPNIRVTEPERKDDQSFEPGTLVIAPFNQRHRGLWKVEGSFSKFVALTALDEKGIRTPMGENMVASEVFPAYPFGR